VRGARRPAGTLWQRRSRHSSVALKRARERADDAHMRSLTVGVVVVVAALLLLIGQALLALAARTALLGAPSARPLS